MYKIKGVAAVAVLLFVAVAMFLLGGCGNQTGAVGTAEEPEESVGAASEEAVLDIEDEEENPLVVGCKKLEGNFNAFYAENSADLQIVKLTSAYLLGKDRSGAYILNGIAGETKSYQGTEYTYTGIADCTVTETKNGEVYYDFTLREELYFSDGTPLTADDVIFTLYVYLDPSYTGPGKLAALPIRGLSDYREYARHLYECMLALGEDNTDFSYYTKEQQDAFFQTDWPAAKEAYIEAICDYCGTDSVGEAMAAMGYANWSSASGSLVSAYTYRTWTMEGTDVPDASDFWEELQKNTAYLNDFDLLMENMVSSGIVDGTVYDYLPDEYQNTVDVGETVDAISGIVKTGEYSLRIILEDACAGALDALAVPIQSLGYFGDAENYNYASHKFGFIKGNLTAVKSVTEVTVGAGPYRVVSYSKNTVSLAANDYYWKGTPQISEIQCVATSDYDMALEIVEGTLDLAEPSIAKSDLELIRGVNSNGLDSGDILTMSLSDEGAYGYIGMNSENVCVGDDPSSQASRYLRTAIATVLAAYREQSVDDYYGETAVLVDYPISRTSWAYIDEDDPDYERAFSTDINGNVLYDGSSTASERKEAVLNAALEYFEAAGYTVEDGKLLEAPEGASLEYEILISGGGEGDHPSYKLLKKAAALLKKLGFTLTITDVADGNEIYQACLEGEAQLWCAAWAAQDDPDTSLSALYSDSGSGAYMYRVRSEKLDALLEKAASAVSQEKRKKLYKKCFACIADYAVEIPVYQRQTCTLYSTKRVDTDTIVQDATANYTWMDEIERLALAG